MINIVVNMQVGRCKHKHIIKSFNLCVAVLRRENKGQRDGVKNRQWERGKRKRRLGGRCKDRYNAERNKGSALLLSAFLSVSYLTVS